MSQEKNMEDLVKTGFIRFKNGIPIRFFQPQKPFMV